MALTEAQLTQLAEHGIANEEEFLSLSERDQQALLADTPDDTQPVGSDTVKPDAGNGDPPDLPAATPAPTTAPAPPAATPAPTTAPAPPAATPAPTTAPATQEPPVATPAPTSAPAPAVWRAVPPADPLGLDAVIDVAPPPQIVKADDDTKKVELKGKLDELFDQFAEGVLKKDEYQTQKKALEEELEGINGRLSAQMGLDAQHGQKVQETWFAIVDAGIKAAKDQGGIDYHAPENKAQADELNLAVQRFGKAAPLMHPDKSATWRDKWAMAEALKEVGERHGKPFAPPKKDAPGASAPAATPAPARPAADLTGLPPTLRQAPNAADANLQADEFAYIDTLTPIEAEKAVAKMTPEQEARYLAR